MGSAPLRATRPAGSHLIRPCGAEKNSTTRVSARSRVIGGERQDMVKVPQLFLRASNRVKNFLGHSIDSKKLDATPVQTRNYDF